MIMENKQSVMRALAVFGIVLLSMSAFVSALGVSIHYTKNSPLQLSPGESKTVPLNLQNVVGTSDVPVRLTISHGSEVATMDVTDYVLKAGSSDTYASVLVSVPSDAAIGTEYPITLTLSTLGTGQQGQMIALATAMDVSFPVKVVAPKVTEKPGMSSGMLWVIGVIVALAVLWILFKLLLGKKK